MSKGMSNRKVSYLLLKVKDDSAHLEIVIRHKNQQNRNLDILANEKR